MNINGENWLTMKEVAEILNCGNTNVSALKNANKIHFEVVEGLLRCTEEELNRYLNMAQGKGKESPFANIMLDWDESCKFLYSYEPQSPYYPYFTPSLKYLVSNKGRIFSVDYTRELTQYKETQGYYQVTISGRNGQKIQCLVHRLVAGIWCSNFHNKSHVHHINGKETDNQYGNLIWVTELEHKELHRLLKTKQRKEYKALLGKIHSDNAYPEEWKNGISIIDPDAEETENYVYYLHLTKRGFEKYQKKGIIAPYEILREVAYAKNIDDERKKYKAEKALQKDQECSCDTQECDISASNDEA